MEKNMRLLRADQALWVVFAFSIPAAGISHPTGNMITVGDKVLWSYINPLDDPSHQACIMIWNQDSEPTIFLQSEYSASDFMLCSHENEIYILERKYVEAKKNFHTRLLKTTLDTKPKVIWDWFEDVWRIGEGGFFMQSDTQMIFCRYPGIFKLKKGGIPQEYLLVDQPVKRIRSLKNQNILLLSDLACYLLGPRGNILKQWDNLIDPQLEYPPLNRNQIFDADFNNGELLLAYWGKRSFETIDKNGIKSSFLQQAEPFVPHWVAFLGSGKLLFSSRFIFNGSLPKPHLVLHTIEGDLQIIWNES